MEYAVELDDTAHVILFRTRTGVECVPWWCFYGQKKQKQKTVCSSFSETNMKFHSAGESPGLWLERQFFSIT